VVARLMVARIAFAGVLGRFFFGGCSRSSGRGKGAASASLSPCRGSKRAKHGNL
jgi:hypothetical protein